MSEIKILGILSLVFVLFITGCSSSHDSDKAVIMPPWFKAPVGAFDFKSCLIKKRPLHEGEYCLVFKVEDPFPAKNTIAFFERQFIEHGFTRRMEPGLNGGGGVWGPDVLDQTTAGNPCHRGYGTAWIGSDKKTVMWFSLGYEYNCQLGPEMKYGSLIVRISSF
jgi:hypothetical protein